jgi:hypothetical protein
VLASGWQSVGGLYRNRYLRRPRGLWIVGVELAEEAVRLADLPAARARAAAPARHRHAGGRVAAGIRSTMVNGVPVLLIRSKILETSLDGVSRKVTIGIW